MQPIQIVLTLRRDGYIGARIPQFGVYAEATTWPEARKQAVMRALEALMPTATLAVVEDFYAASLRVDSLGVLVTGEAMEDSESALRSLYEAAFDAFSSVLPAVTAEWDPPAA